MQRSHASYPACRLSLAFCEIVFKKKEVTRAHSTSGGVYERDTKRSYAALLDERMQRGANTISSRQIDQSSARAGCSGVTGEARTRPRSNRQMLVEVAPPAQEPPSIGSGVSKVTYDAAALLSKWVIALPLSAGVWYLYVDDPPRGR